MDFVLLWIECVSLLLLWMAIAVILDANLPHGARRLATLIGLTGVAVTSAFELTGTLGIALKLQLHFATAFFASVALAFLIGSAMLLWTGLRAAEPGLAPRAAGRELAVEAARARGGLRAWAPGDHAARHAHRREPGARAGHRRPARAPGPAQSARAGRAQRSAGLSRGLSAPEHAGDDPRRASRVRGARRAAPGLDKSELVGTQTNSSGLLAAGIFDPRRDRLAAADFRRDEQPPRQGRRARAAAAAPRQPRRRAPHRAQAGRESPRDPRAAGGVLGPARPGRRGDEFAAALRAPLEARRRGAGASAREAAQRAELDGRRARAARSLSGAAAKPPLAGDGAERASRSCGALLPRVWGASSSRARRSLGTSGPSRPSST